MLNKFFIQLFDNKYLVFGLLTFLCLFSLQNSANAQSNAPSMTVSENEILVGTTFVVEIRLPFNQNLNSSDIPIKGSAEFLSERRGSQTSIINSRRFQEYYYAFQFRALKEDEIIIGPLTVDYSGQEYVFNEIIIQVKSREDFGIQEFEIPEWGNISHPVSDNISALRSFVGTYFSALEVPDKIYEGQVFPAITYFFKKNDDSIKWPSAGDMYNKSQSDFIQVEEFSVRNTQNQHKYAGDNNEFVGVPAYGEFVYPIKSGKMTVEGVSIPIGESSRSFFRFNKLFDLVAPTREIEVLPLPDTGVKVNSRFIGDTVYIAENFQADNVEVGDLIELNVMLSGTAYLKPVSLNVPEDIPGLLHVSTTSNFEKRSQGEFPLRTEKSFKIEYQVLEPGTIEMPSMEFAIFNPDTEEYSFKSTKSYTFEATGSKVEVESLTASAGDSNNLPESEEPLPEVETATTLPPVGLEEYQKAKQESFELAGENKVVYYTANTVAVSMSMMWFLFFGFIKPSRWYQNRNKKALKIKEIEHEFDQVKSAAKKNDLDQFFQKTDSFLYLFFDHKYDINIRGYEETDLQTKLTELVDEEKADQIIQIRSELETYRYAPDAAQESLERHLDVLQSLLELIKEEEES